MMSDSVGILLNKDIVSKAKDLGVQNCSKWVFEHSSVSQCSSVSKNPNSYLSMCKRIYEKYKKLLKSKRLDGGEELQHFLCENVQFPEKLESPKSRGKETSENIRFLQEKSDNLTSVAADLAVENCTLKQELHSIQEKHKVKLSKVGVIQQLKNSIQESKEREKVLLKANKSLQFRVSQKASEIKKLRLRVSYVEQSSKKKSDDKLQQIQGLRNQLEELENELNNQRIHNEELEVKLKDFDDENIWLREMVNNNIITFDDQSRTYTADLQKCVFELLNYNVSFQNVSPVISSVLQLVNIKPNKLPSKTTVNNMNIERLALSQKHIAEELGNEENLCLLSDETNKFGTKIEGMHATDSSGNYWVLGLREMTTKAGKDILKTLLNILGDIEATSRASENPVSKTILKNISSTMSDRASTQTKFNELLEVFRTDIIKEDLGDQWDQMSAEEQSSVSKLCNFFCSLHALVHMAETCSKALVEHENELFDDAPILDKSFKKSSEPGCVRLVRTCCKAFARGGDEKNGQFCSFNTYIQDMLKENQFQSIPLERFRGNRFNILFRNAGVVFFLKDKLASFLELEHSNRLLQAVKHDIGIPEYVAHCKALGLICELVTVPLWEIIENDNVHITESSAVYQELVQYLEKIVENCGAFMKGSYLLSFVNVGKLNSSPVFAALKKDWEHDAKVAACLQVLIPALCQLCQRLFKDYLSGGTWFESPESVKERTRGVPKHNKFSESIFGHMDRLLREKPNTTQIAYEANIMFVHNKTLSWLKEKNPREQERIIKEARSDVNALRKAFKIRRQQLETERQQILNEKLQKAQQVQQARIEKKEGLTNDIQVWGLWQTDEDVDTALSRIKTKTDKVKALKCQLHFRQKVLRQTSADKNVYCVSKKVGNKTKPLSDDELALNVKKLVRKAYTEVVPENAEENQLFIIGQNIKHAFREDNGDLKWYTGQVISQVPGFPDWFNVKYNGDRAIYTYELLVEYRNGDLRILI